MREKLKLDALFLLKLVHFLGVQKLGISQIDDGKFCIIYASFDLSEKADTKDIDKIAKNHTGPRHEIMLIFC